MEVELGNEIGRYLLDHGAAFTIEEAGELAGGIMGLVREHVGATQEKLFNDLQNERAIRVAGERREEALAESVASLYFALNGSSEGNDGESATERASGSTE
jgi:hypothetical protein